MKVFLIVLGCLVALLGGACGAVGAAFLTVVGTDGYIESGWEHVNVESSALVSGRQQVDRLRGLAHGADSGADVTIRVRAESRNPDKEVFIGIAPREPLLDYAKNARLDLSTTSAWTPRGSRRSPRMATVNSPPRRGSPSGSPP